MKTEPNAFSDLTKIMQQFKVTGLDMTPIIESRRKDMEALVEANKATYDAMQSLVRKQTEILSQAMQAIQHSAKDFLTGGAGAPDTVKQSKLIGDAYEKALADMRNLAEIARKSQVDAMTGITHRAAESLAEMKKLMKPA